MSHEHHRKSLRQHRADLHGRAEGPDNGRPLTGRPLTGRPLGANHSDPAPRGVTGLAWSATRALTLMLRSIPERDRGRLPTRRALKGLRMMSVGGNTPGVKTVHAGGP
jgi:hypothetical protein